jgi:hypothetical protein
VNIRAFPAFLQDQREVQTATGTLGSPNAGCCPGLQGREEFGASGRPSLSNTQTFATEYTVQRQGIE